MTRSLALLPLLILLAAFAPAQDRSFMVGSFDRIRVSGPYQVTVRTGSPSARATAEDRHALVKFDVHLAGNTLVVQAGQIGWDGHDSVAQAARIEITTPHLRALTVNGGGDVRVAAMDGDRVDASVNGAGSIAIDAVDAREFRGTVIGTGAITAGGKAQTARLSSNGAGSLDAGALSAGDVIIVSQSTGTMRAQARNTAQVMAMGSGTVAVSGSGRCTVSGPGPVTCAGEVTRAR